MSEKKDCLIQIKVTKTEKEKIQCVVNDLKKKGHQGNINISELARQGIENLIYIYEKIENGSSLCFMPESKEIIDNKKAMIELETLSNDVNLSNYTRKVLAEMSDSIEFAVLNKLKEKYPNHIDLILEEMK